VSATLTQTPSPPQLALQRILIVEDEVIIAMDMAQQLRGFGYEVVGIAANAQRARELALQTRPDLVMMDIVLKGPQDGIEAAQAIAAEVDTAVVFLTAYGDPATIERAKAAGPLGYLLKPFRPHELRSTIEVALHRRQLERRVRESEHWLVKTLQCIGDGVLATDPQGRLRLINPVACTLLGLRETGAQGQDVRKVFRLVAEDSHEPLPDLVAQVLDGPESVALVRGLLHDPRGEPTIFVDAGASRIRGDNGHVLGVVVVLRDVTRRRLDEIELVRYRDHLEQLVRERTLSLEAARAEAERSSQAKSDFLSLVSHELRTPLNAVLGFCELLQLQPLESRPRGYVDHIRAAGGHLLALIDDLLDLTRVGAGQLQIDPAPVGLAEVLEQVRHIVEPMTLERQLHFVVTPPPGATVLWADRKRLVQVLVNLVSNAIKYSRREGHVDVQCAAAGERRVRITVTDDGQGIALAKQALLFRPFERLGAERSEVEGMGLGLAFAKSLVEAMGGEIGFDSEPGRGSRFWIDMPLAP
jgi:PAS domain S-box-containing protein